MPPKRTRVTAAAEPAQEVVRGRTTRRNAAKINAPDDMAAAPAKKNNTRQATTAPAAVKKAALAPARKSSRAKQQEQREVEDEHEDVMNGLVRDTRKRPTRGRRDPLAMAAGALGSPTASPTTHKPEGEAEAEQVDEFDVPVSQEYDTTTNKRKSTTTTTIRPRNSSAAKRKTDNPLKSSARKADKGKAGSTPRSAPRSGRKLNFTPLVGDSSVAALQHFRRRPRAPSLLSAVHNGVLDTSVLDQTDSLLGNTEELGTSMLDTTVEHTAEEAGSAAQVQEEVDGDSGDLGLELGGGDLTLDDEAFRPDMEGTPLPGRFESNVTEAKRRKSLYEDDEDLYVVSPRKKRGTKRKSDEISSGHDSAVAPNTQDQATQRTIGGTAVEVLRSSPPAEDVQHERTGRRSGSSSDLSSLRSASLPRFSAVSSARSSTPRRADLDSDTYADPRSDSSVSDEVEMIPSPKKRRGDAVPNNARERRVTSAMLRALLPRRVMKRDESFDVSGIESDEEDRPSRKTGWKVLGEAKSKKNMKVGAGKTAKMTKPTRTTRGEEKENAEAVDIGADKGKRKTYGSKAATKPASKTYGRRRRERSLEDESDGETGGSLSKELQAARDKFKQIDKGGLEFDSASISGGSSPWR
ncbi:Hypothetical protein D9617_8g049740 [Elsinoe fawcettii]|nr:Hypothetical protein D9617_8g049740 [Elsinoe fawcettii]